MTLACCKLRLAAEHARLVFADGRAADLTGPRMQQLLQAAQPVLDYLRSRGAHPLRAISLRLSERVLRATYQGDGHVAVVRVDGEQFIREVAPLCGQLVAAARRAAPRLERHDVAPDFVLPTASGVPTRFYGTAGGQPSVLAFIADDDAHAVAPALRTLASELDLALYAVVRTSPGRERFEHAREEFVDSEGDLWRRWGAGPGSTLYVLDANLRIVEAVHGAPAIQAGDAVRDALARATSAAADDSYAPVLLVPNALDLDLCTRLCELAALGSQPTGIERSAAGQRRTEIDPSFKRRRDHVVADQALIAELTHRLSCRIMPEVAKAFSFAATRFEGFKIGCYDARERGRFRRHRDNLSRATAHRRFAVSLNLNEDYAGGELRFPEYGLRAYRPRTGGAVVFSCSLLHEALEVTDGRRFVLLTFLYGDQDQRLSRPPRTAPNG
jgi:predicted 2-oxoglutarate/Fe(II)-dependent dioxygenase YbiX